MPAQVLHLGCMTATYQPAALFILRKGQGMEDVTSPTVEQQDMQVLGDVLVPQAILVIEESQVTNEQVVGTVRLGRRKAYGSTHATLPEPHPSDSRTSAARPPAR